MKASTKRILSILFSAFFLMATLVVYGSLIQPEINSASQLQALVASKTNLFNNQKAAVAQVSGLISQFRSASNLQQTLGLAIPVGPNTTQALSQWQAIAVASQSTMESLNIQPGQSLNQKGQNQLLVKKLSSIPTDVNVSGSYGALKQFLNSLETNARVMNVNDFDFKAVSFSQVGGGPSVPAYSMQLNVTAYYQQN